MKIRPSLSHVQAYPPPPCPRRDKVRLDMNENAYGPSPRVLASLRRMQSTDLSVYPEYAPLRQRIARKHRMRKQNICLTAGGDEAIRALFLAFVEPGEDVIIPRPSFSIFNLAASQQRARVSAVPYRSDFSYPADEVEAAIAPCTRMVVAVSPNNPTGTSISADALVRILEKNDRGLVVLDHTYSFFSGIDLSGLVRRYSNLAVIHSFSKSYGLAGMRLGYVLSHPETIASLERVLPPFSVNALALIAALAALDDREHLKRTLSRLRQEKEYLRHGVQKLKIEVHGGDANFILARFRERCGALVQYLLGQGILIKHFPSEPLLEGWARISVGSRADSDRLLDSLHKFCGNPNIGGKRS